MAQGTIWLLDHDPAVLHAIAFFLTTQGYTVHPFDTAGALVAASEGMSEGCLLVDHHLPSIDGLHVIGLLRARGSRLPAVLLTSCVSDAERTRSSQLDIPVVEKPLLNDDLGEALRRVGCG